MRGEMLFVLGNAALGYAAWRIASRLVPARFTFGRAVASLGGFAVLALLIVLGLGFAGALRPLPATVSAVAVALVTLLLPRLGRAEPSLDRLPEDLDPPGIGERAVARITLGLVVVVGAAYVGHWALRGTCFGFDDLSYHAAQPAWWVVEGRFTEALGNYQAYYPHNAETLAAWLMLPFHADGQVGLLPVYWALVAGVAMTCIARNLGASRAAAPLPAVLLLASGVVLRRQNSFCGDHLAGPAMLLAATAFVLQPAGERNLLPLSAAAYAGAFAGYAAGMKLPFAVQAVVAWMWVLWTSLRVERSWHAIGRAALFAAAAFATGGWWYLQNALVTGNPLFPASLPGLAGPFSAEQRAPTTLISWLLGYRQPVSWAPLKGYAFDWPWPLFACAAAGYLAALVAAVTKRRRVRPGGFRPRAFLLVMGGAGLLLFPFLPFSATWEWPDSPLEPQSRYLIHVFALGLALLTPLLRNRRWPAIAATAAMLAGAVASILSSARSLSPERAPVLALGLLALLVVAALLAPTLASWAIRVRGRWWITGLAGLLLLAAATPRMQRLADRALPSSVTKGDWVAESKPMREVLAALDRLPAGSRVTWFLHHPHLSYPFFGRRLQLVPVPTDGDGAARPPLHGRWRGESHLDWWIMAGSVAEPMTEGRSLGSNLRAARIDAVVVTQWRAGVWPEQQAELERLAAETPPRAVKAFDDGYSALWLLPGGPAGLTALPGDPRSDSPRS